MHILLEQPSDTASARVARDAIILCQPAAETREQRGVSHHCHSASHADQRTAAIGRSLAC